MRQRQIVYGVATREQVAGKSGLELFKAMIAGELPAPPISQTLDFILVEAEHGRVVFQGRPGFAHYNPMGIVHGGWFATLLDSALGCAVAVDPARGQGLHDGRAEGQHRPAADRQGAASFAPRAASSTAAAGWRPPTARLTGPDGKLYAHGSTTCFIFDN